MCDKGREESFRATGLMGDHLYMMHDGAIGKDSWEIRLKMGQTTDMPASERTPAAALAQRDGKGSEMRCSD